MAGNKDRAITQREKDILNLMMKGLERNHVMPSLSELGQTIGTQARNVGRSISNLEMKGYVQRHPWVARGVKILKDGDGNPVKLVFTHTTDTYIEEKV